MFTLYEEIPEDDLRKIEIFTSFDELWVNIQGVPGGMCQTSGGCSLC